MTKTSTPWIILLFLRQEDELIKKNIRGKVEKNVEKKYIQKTKV